MGGTPAGSNSSRLRFPQANKLHTEGFNPFVSRDGAHPAQRPSLLLSLASFVHWSPDGARVTGLQGGEWSCARLIFCRVC